MKKCVGGGGNGGKANHILNLACRWRRVFSKAYLWGTSAFRVLDSARSAWPIRGRFKPDRLPTRLQQTHSCLSLPISTHSTATFAYSRPQFYVHTAETSSGPFESHQPTPRAVCCTAVRWRVFTFCSVWGDRNRIPVTEWLRSSPYPSQPLFGDLGKKGKGRIEKITSWGCHLTLYITSGCLNIKWGSLLLIIAFATMWSLHFRPL
jgi:hypothetical protein